MAIPKAVMTGKQIFDITREVFKENKNKFECNEDELTIVSNFQGDDLPIVVVVRVHEESQIIRFISKLMFDIPIDKEEDIISAINDINSKLPIGYFNYDKEHKTLLFVITHFYANTVVTKELISVLFLSVLTIADRYDGDLKSLAPSGWRAIDPLYG